MPMGQILTINLAVIAGAMCLIWGISLARKDASIVDLFWGLGFVLVAWVSLAITDIVSPRAYLVSFLVSVWGIRLSSYLTWRNWAKPEDYRYAAMRKRHGGRFSLVSLITVFGLQGAIMWFVSLPIQVGIAKSELTPQLPVWIGITVYSVGLLFETLGDYQLARFKANPSNRGHVMSQGLWRYTRHPNYFGDFLIWWGFYLVAVESGSWWWTITGPLLMSYFLIRVSGVRLLEDSLRSRVAGYEEYIHATSAFIPWLPKKPPRSS
jgi:steroid 5-alpha reductase family enzyme